MSEQIFRLSVEWNGATLICRAAMSDGWRKLTDAPLPRPQRFVTACSGLEGMTPFEVGLFVAAASRVLTNEWERQRLSDLQSLALFDDLPGERS